MISALARSLSLPLPDQFPYLGLPNAPRVRGLWEDEEVLLLPSISLLRLPKPQREKARICACANSTHSSSARPYLQFLFSNSMKKPTPPLSFDFIASSERGILNDEILSLSASPASHVSPSLPAFPATVAVQPPSTQFLLTSAFLPSAVSISGIAK